MTALIILDKIRFIIMLPLILLTAVTTPKPVDTESAALITQKMYVAEQALVCGQGVTAGGDYLYTSGAITALNLTFLGKIDLETMTYVDRVINPLPDVCKERGNNHIGGISYYNGKIYAPVEGGDVTYACIAVYDAKNLEETGEVYDLPNEYYDDGVPWLAVDPETGLLYASKWSHADKVYVYDVNDGMKQVKEIGLTGIGELDRIQGGEFLNGKLYLSQDSKDSGTVKKMLTLDIQTGNVSVAAERDVNGTNTEAEDMTFVIREGETRMLVIDYNKFIGIFMREYNIPV